MELTAHSPQPMAGIKNGTLGADNTSTVHAFFEEAPLSTEEIARLVDDTGWSAEFSWEQIATLAKYCGAYYVLADTILLREGDSDRFLCLVTEGRVRIVKEEGFGQEPHVIATLGPGQAFGEMALIDAEPRSATVVAATDTTLVRLSIGEFDRLLSEDPHLGIALLTKIARLMSQRLRQTSGRLVEALEAMDTCLIAKRPQ